VKRATVSLLLLLSINAVAQDSSKPRISPFFDRIDEESAFFEECRNTTGETVSAARNSWLFLPETMRNLLACPAN
jgi:hypothetical protein